MIPKQIIISAFSHFDKLMGIYIHGSVAKGTARKDSDLDIALLFHHDFKVRQIELLEISGDLEARMGRPVHIAVLSRDDLVFAKEVIGHGKRIYCKNQYYCDTFEMYALSFYAEWNEQRQPIIDNYIKKTMSDDFLLNKDAIFERCIVMNF